mgnify:CR=1 FL=1
MIKEDIIRICENTKKLLIKKNKAYGNSAINPIGVFGDGDAIKALGARMDDKLMRIKSLGVNESSIDTLYDLHGYITLLIIAIERQENIDSMDSVCEDDSNTKKILNAREKSNDVSEHQRDNKSKTNYSTNMSGTYQEWETEILD